MAAQLPAPLTSLPARSIPQALPESCLLRGLLLCQG